MWMAESSAATIMALKIFLDEARAEMDVELHERPVADALEPVNLACFDHENVSSAGFELLAVHRPESPALPHELDFVVRMTMGTWSSARHGAEEKYRHVDIAVVGA